MNILTWTRKSNELRFPITSALGEVGNHFITVRAETLQPAFVPANIRTQVSGLNGRISAFMDSYQANHQNWAVSTHERQFVASATVCLNHLMSANTLFFMILHTGVSKESFDLRREIVEIYAFLYDTTSQQAFDRARANGFS